MVPPPRPMPLIVELAALTLWLGGSILFAAVVAPALFAALSNRTLAGDVVGRVLPTLLYSGIVVSLLALFTEALAAGGVFAPRPILALVITAACVAALVIGRHIDRLRVSIAGPVDALDAADPRRVDFGRLHGLSVGALGLGMLAGAVLAISAARRLAARGVS